MAGVVGVLEKGVVTHCAELCLQGRGICLKPSPHPGYFSGAQACRCGPGQGRPTQRPPHMKTGPILSAGVCLQEGGGSKEGQA